MGATRTVKEQRLMDELLAEFSEELRTTGTTNFGILERCPSPWRTELRSLMNTAALMHWATDRAAERASAGAARPERRFASR